MAVAAGLVAAASLVGWWLIHRGVAVLVGWPPLLADWLPHLGPGTVPAILIALAVALRGPAVAARLRWGPLLAAAWAASLAWTVALALVDGFARGFAGRLMTATEYLHDVPRVRDIPAFLTGFAALIPSGQPGFWTTHVAGHPPLATLVFVWLDRVGLGGGAWASTVVVVAGTSAVVAVAVTLAVLADRDTARRYLPFGVLFPGAVWVGVSADGMFAAVFAWGLALLACAAVRRDWIGLVLGLCAGVVLGAALFMSYGLAVAGLLPLAVALLTRRIVPLLTGGLGVGLVVAVFAAAGFSWPQGYQQVLVRYAQPGEYGGLRPYDYWVWANLAALTLAVGPAVIAGLRRLAWRPRAAPTAVLALVAAAAVAVAAADLSGLSKAEVERIWLPFDLWLTIVTVLLPRPHTRWWLLAQAILTLLINHLLLTVW